MKTKVWKGIIIFVAFMVVFTIASRIVMQICTPTVEVVYAQMGTINKIVQEESVVQGSREIAVITEPGIRISEVNVHQGSQVEKGELLYTYDIEHLKEKQKELKNQIAVLDWQIADEQAILQTMPEASTTNLKQLNLSRKSLAEEKKVLDELIKNEGKVYAETGGQIVRVDLSVGRETTGSADIMMADYTNVLPREALRYDGMDYFVYAVKEEETIMGVEYRISKQKVEVLDMNENYVAVDQVSMLLPIVVDSDKHLTEDGRVRYAETND